MIADFLTSTPDLAHLFLLIDSRHELQKIDMRCTQWLFEHHIPFTIVLTKTDKIPKYLLSKRLEAWNQHCQAQFKWVPPLLYSSTTREEGREEILKTIDKYAHKQNTKAS